MKFTAVVVLLALALSIEASTIALAPSLTYTAVSGPALLAAQPAWGHAAWAPASSWSIQSSWAGPHAAIAAPHAAIAAPHTAIIAPHAAIAAPHSAIAPAWGHEGSYIAKTRGAIHIAPLAGHANSAASINLQPAPGTI